MIGCFWAPQTLSYSVMHPSGLTKWFEIVNVSLVVIKVLVASHVTVLLLQLLSIYHVGTNGSISRPMKLPKVNLWTKQDNIICTV